MVSGGPSTEAGTAKRDIYFYELESACSHRGPTTAMLSPTQDPPTYHVACLQYNTSWNSLPDTWYKTRAGQAQVRHQRDYRGWGWETESH